MALYFVTLLYIKLKIISPGLPTTTANMSSGATGNPFVLLPSALFQGFEDGSHIPCLPLACFSLGKYGGFSSNLIS